MRNKLLVCVLSIKYKPRSRVARANSLFRIVKYINILTSQQPNEVSCLTTFYECIIAMLKGICIIGSKNIVRFHCCESSITGIKSCGIINVTKYYIWDPDQSYPA